MQHTFLNFRFLTTCTLFIWLWSSAMAQTRISGHWGNQPDQLITLWMLRGDLRLPVDSVRTGASGQFSLTTHWKVPAGMYLIEDESGENSLLILGSGDVVLNKDSVMLIESSPDNKVWQEWIKIKSSFLKKQQALENLIESYPADEKFHRAAVVELEKQRKVFIKTVLSLKKNPEAKIAARFINADMPPMLEAWLSPEQKLDALRKYMLNVLSSNDTLLIQSDMLPTKVLDYLSLFQLKGMTRPAVEEAFLGAIDALLDKASVQKEMYFFYLEYLFEGFQRLGFNQITDFLAGLPHFDTEKATTHDLFEIERIIGPYHNILKGRAAPELIGQDFYGNTFNINDLHSKNFLILFWSEDCPHCTRLVPELKALMTSYPSIAVITVVLGGKTPSLEQFIRNSGIENWIHLIEPDGWRSRLVESYSVFGTPSMYLLDSEKRIIARPNTVSELRETLGKQ